jgi:hypothetical protein
MFPGEVTRVVVRWAPQNIPAGDVLPGTNRAGGAGIEAPPPPPQAANHTASPQKAAARENLTIASRAAAL